MMSHSKWDMFALLVFIVLFSFIGATKLWDNQLSHDSPTGFMASDAFTHNWVAQNTYNTGYINQPPRNEFPSEEAYLQNADNFKMFHPPILPILTASISMISGTEVYDVNIILVFLLVVFIILINYLILSKFSEALALFSLPLSLLFIERKFFIAVSWGWWDFITGQFFLFAIIFLAMSERFRHKYLLSALLILAAFMAHGVEAIYAAVFIILYIAFSVFIRKEKIYPLILEQVKSFLLVILVGAYQASILLKTMGAMGYHQFQITTFSDYVAKYASNSHIFFEEFIGFRLMIIAGALILLYLLITKKHKLLPYYIFIIFMSAVPYLYFTSVERGLQWRLLWPIYLSFTIGAAIYLLYSLITKYVLSPISRLATKYSLFGVSLLLITIIILPQPFLGPGLLDTYDYESYKWVWKETDVHSQFLILFSPINNQISRTYLLSRPMFIATLDSWEGLDTKSTYLLNLQNFRNNTLLGGFFCDDCSFLKESQFLNVVKDAGLSFIQNKSICEFDYIYIPLKNQQEIHNKNAAYINYLINRNISQVVFNNQGGAIIARNIAKGEECEHKFR